MGVRINPASVTGAVTWLCISLFAGGCGFGGGTTTDAISGQSGQAFVAQAIVLRAQGNAQGGLEVLLAQTGSNIPLGPNAWGFPSGGSSQGDQGAGPSAAKDLAITSAHDQAGVDLEVSDLVPYAHWLVTGFDTIFYLASAPPGSKPRPDGTLTVDAAWFRPERALAMHSAGKMAIGYPTLKQLESLTRFDSAGEALDTARRSNPKPVELQIVGRGDKVRALLPADVPQG